MQNKTSLKSIATKGMFWSAIDKFASQAGQFIIGILLARLLMPKDFGLIGMLSIFLAISQTFINSGMGAGLIQKKDRTEVDFSTVFVFNFGVSLFFYLLLFFTAPLIADFYDMPQLVLITRVLCINIVINSLAIVQRTRLTINIDFKVFAKVNVISVICGGILGVVFALMGYGVWALVIQYLSSSTVSIIMLWHLSRWKPSIIFSKQSFKELFGFGSKLLITGLYAKSLQNIYNITIGKIYSASELGFYTRAKGFAELTSGTVTSVLNQVTFPILASLQNEEDRMISVFSRLFRMTAFFIFPVMTLLALLADPIIRILLGEKWIPVIVFLQWMCFAKIFYPINSLNMSILKAIGRSDLFLKVDLSKIPLTIIALFITIPLGVKAIIIGQVVTTFIAFFINAYMPGKLFGYGAIAQLKDMISVFISTLIMAVSVFLAIFLMENLYLKIIIGGLTGIGVYGLMVTLLKLQEVEEVKKLILKIRE